MDLQAAPTVPQTASANPITVLQEMLDGLGVKAKVEQHVIDDAVLLHIATADPGRLIGKQGQTLNELQFLLNRILQRKNPDAPRVIVDCERYRERQREELIQQALDAADKVRRWGEAVKIGPFNAFDRRVIHMHIDRDQELEAISEEGGDESRKKMIIRVRQTPK